MNEKYMFQIDECKYFKKIDGSKTQLYLSGWCFDKDTERSVQLALRYRFLDGKEGLATPSVEEVVTQRKDVADMYDLEEEKIGFQMTLTADFDLDEVLEEICVQVSEPNFADQRDAVTDTVTADTESAAKTSKVSESTDVVPAENVAVDTRKEEVLYQLTGKDILTKAVDNVHYFEDQFALNDTVIRMAGWGYLSDLHKEYRPLMVWARDSKTKETVAKAEYMIRQDIISLFDKPEDQNRQWGFFLLLDLKEHPDCEICFGEETCNKVKAVNLYDLQREKREKRRVYKNRLDMMLHGDADLRKDDAYYKKHLSTEAYQEILQKRFQNKDVDYDVWIRRHSATEKELKRQRLACKDVMEDSKYPLVSIAVPAYRTPVKFLKEMIDSVKAQTYPKWELCIADGSLNDSILPTLQEYAAADSRVKFRTLEDNFGISGNTNEALKLATGDYISLLDHDDILTPDALYEMVKCVMETGADCLYSDEDKVDFSLEDYFEPHFKPDFNLDMLRSCNYICHFFMVRKDVLERAGLFRDAYDGSQDFDFILRCTGEATQVQHVRKMLYHWRSHAASTAMNPENKMYCYEAGREAILTELKKQGYEGATVRNYTRLGYYEPIYPVPANVKVSVVLPEESKGFFEEICEAQVEAVRRRIEQLEATKLETERVESEQYETVQSREQQSQLEQTKTESPQEQQAQVESAGKEFEILTYKKEDELAERLPEILAQTTGDAILFIHGDLRDASEGWINRLLGNVMRDEVGIVAPMVYNEIGRISSSGKVLYRDGRIRDLFKGILKEEPGYAAHALMQQNVSMLSPNCFMMRRELLEQFHFGKDAISFGEGDTPMHVMAYLCHQATQAGKLLVYTPFVQVKEKESPISEDIRIPGLATNHADPYYHPDFDEDGDVFTLCL